MKYIQFSPKNKPDEIRVGYLSENNVIDIGCQDCSMPRTMLDILKFDAADKVKSFKFDERKTIPLSSVTLAAPIHGVDKILGVALNYADLCKELGIDNPDIPVVFSKFSSTIIGPNQPLRIRTDVCKHVDYEVELAVVIGKPASSVKADDAKNYIFGYTIVQDISERVWQKEKNGTQFLLGKSLDTFCPIGPWIVTDDEIDDPHSLALTCSVNGVEKQNSNTSNMIHSIPSIIERLTTVMTLLPGDLILTGTPAGVGATRHPPEFLKPGDVIRSDIENIGFFETKVVEF